MAKSRLTTTHAVPVVPRSDQVLDGEDKLSRTRAGLVLTGWGTLGLFASVALSIETYLKIHNPNYSPLCAINPLVSCSGTFKAWQGNLLGVPNAYLGVLAYIALLAIAIAVWRGLPLPKWLWWGLAAGVVTGFGYTLFFVSVSIMSLRTLCPYCMVVWLSAIPLFVYGVAITWQEGLLPGPAGLRRLWVKNRVIVVVVLLAVIAVTIVLGLMDKWQYLLI